ncbi:MAG: class I SAM-dependent methyltransferase [Akkermansiaceae bacterium]
MKTIPLISALVLVAALSFLLWNRDKREPLEDTPPETSAEARKEIPPPDRNPDELYTEGEKTRDGIGKYYHGREIAHVMGHQAINWLERNNRESEEAPSLAMAMLDLGETDVLADIGAGSGYYSFRLAIQRPKGKVIAVDIQPEMVAFLDKKKEKLGVENLETHLGKIDDTELPPGSIDAALIVDAYHEFSHPYEMMLSLYHALRPGGKIYLLEYRAEDPDVPIKRLHKMSEAQARKELEFVGFEWEKTLDNLPWQHLLVFRKP